MAKSGRKTGRIIIIVAVVLIILLLGAVYAYMQLQPILQPQTVETQAVQAPVEEMVNIVITTQFIPRGEVITEGVIAEIPFPKKELVEGTFITERTQVIGKKAIYPLEPRMPITPSILLDNTTGGSIAAFDIPVDKTALSIPIDREALIAYAPQAGDHVMVIGCMNLVDVDPEYQSLLPNYTASVLKQILTAESTAESLTINIQGGGETAMQGRTELDPTLNEPLYVLPSEAQRPRLVCQNVIQDAIVLRVGEFPIDGVEKSPVVATEVAPAAPDQAQAVETPVEEVKPDIITLIVSPQDAVTLSYMRRANVALSLALRNPNFTQEIITDAVTQQYLMDQKNIPLPAKLPFAMEPFSGTSISTDLPAQ
jgi:pilus assembly protein CpaB